MNVFSSRRHAGKPKTGSGLLLVALCLLATMLFPTTEASAAAARCNGLVVTINMNNGDSGNGTNGNDVILGTPGRDTIQGRGGNDTICGEGGSDRIRGHAGNDTILAGSGNDRVWGGPGNDDLRGMGGHDTMWGDSGRDTMQGNSGNDTLHGGASHDTISGSTGNDVIYGEGGWDKINGGDGNDIADGGDGNDTISGQAGDDTLDGAAGNDTINGGPGTDNCTGESMTNCVPKQYPPTWASSDPVLTFEGFGFHEFTFGWGPISGEGARIDARVYNSAGESNRLPYGYGSNGQLTVSTFDGNVLDKAESYTVTAKIVNDAGESETLTLGPVSILAGTLEVTTQYEAENGSLENSVNALSSPIIWRDCSTMSTVKRRCATWPADRSACFRVTSVRKIDATDLPDNGLMAGVHHTAVTSVCHGSGKITENRSVSITGEFVGTHLCATQGVLAQRPEKIETPSIPSNHPNSQFLRMRYECASTGQITAEARAEIEAWLVNAEASAKAEIQLNSILGVSHSFTARPDGSVDIVIEGGRG